MQRVGRVAVRLRVARHTELTAGGAHGAPAPHPESLLVFYLGDDEAVRKVVARPGVDPIPPANP